MSLLRNRQIRFPCLEPDRIRSWLRDEVDWSDGAHLSDVRLNRLWVARHGRVSFELALELTCGHTIQTCLLQGGGPVGVPSRSHTRGRVSRHGLKGLRLFSNELELWCCTPDRDRRLPAVRALLDQERAASLLIETAAAPLLGLTRTGQRVKCEITAYRATKRCSLRVYPANPEESNGVFVKVFRRAPASEQVEAWRRLPSHLNDLSHGRVRAPAVIDFCSTNRLLITAAVTEAAYPMGTDPEALSAAARTLAVLHDLPAGTASKIHTPWDEFRTVCRWVPTLRGLGEERYRRLRALSVALSRVVGTMDEPDGTLIHRDFFAAQLLRSDETVWVLDFDTLCAGHPEVDVATFVAHLFLDGLLMGAAISEITQKAACFVEEYRRQGGPAVGNRLRFYLPCALARLGAIHSARGVSGRVVDELWELAEGHLARSSWLD